MPTTRLLVPVGTSAAIPVHPQMCVSAGPSVLGGTVLVEFSQGPRGPWFPWPYGTISQGGSLRPPATGYVRVTAATSPANVFLVDFTGANTQFVDQLVNVNATLASASSTAEQTLLSFRTPPGFLPANFTMEIDLAVALTNNANVKTLRLRVGPAPVGGLAGTALFTSPSLASALNYNAMFGVSGRGDGSSLIGFGPGASGGWGVSTTAYPTVTLNYLNQELEWVLTVTKATGSDTAQLESALISVY